MLDNLATTTNSWRWCGCVEGRRGTEYSTPVLSYLHARFFVLGGFMCQHTTHLALDATGVKLRFSVRWDPSINRALFLKIEVGPRSKRYTKESYKGKKGIFLKIVVGPDRWASGARPHLDVY